MLLGIDLRCLPTDGSPGAGIAHAARELARALLASKRAEDSLIGYASRHASASLGFSMMRMDRPDRASLIHSLKIRSCDALFVPSGAVPFGLPVRAYPWVHDLDIFDHPEWFPQSYFRRFMTTRFFLNGLRQAPLMFAVSEYTKRQILSRLRCSERRIVVTGEGGDGSCAALDDPERMRAKRAARERLFARGIKRPFVLIFGTVEPRKNIPFFVRLWASIAKDLASFDLVIAGDDGWKTSETERAIATARAACDGTGTRILRFLNISDSVRLDLLLASELVVTPSLSEGFGLVPLEAIQAGTPALVSDRGALPETIGRGEWMIPLEDVHQWKHVLRRALRDPNLRASWLREQSANISRFSWMRVAETIWNTIQ